MQTELQNKIDEEVLARQQPANAPLPMRKSEKVIRTGLSKKIAVVVFVFLVAGALWFLFRTEPGARIRSDPQGFAQEFRTFVAGHPISAPLAYLGLYILLACISWPIWWLQVLAGVSFGLYEGTFLSVVGSTISTAIAVSLSRWIAADWFRQRIESHLHKLQALDEKMGHNGLLFVMALRMIPVTPFPAGLLNYALGLTKVSFIDAVLGTFLGAIPVIAVHTGIGAGYEPWKWTSWRFDLCILGISLMLLTPLIVRYAKPNWFKKIGVE